MLAFSVREALREAVAAFGPSGHCVDLGCPSTPEQVFWAVEAARAASAGGARLQESHLHATRPQESGFPATASTAAPITVRS
jgi:xanthine dehydrogenase large subunit